MVPAVQTFPMDRKALAARRKARVLEKMEERNRLVSGLEEVESLDPWKLRSARQSAIEQNPQPVVDLPPAEKPDSPPSRRRADKKTGFTEETECNGESGERIGISARSSRHGGASEAVSSNEAVAAVAASSTAGNYLAELCYVLGLILIGFAIGVATAACASADDALFGEVPGILGTASAGSQIATQKLVCTISKAQISVLGVTFSIVVPVLLALRCCTLAAGKALLGWNTEGGALHDVAGVVKQFLPAAMGNNVDNFLVVVAGSPSLVAANVATSILIAVWRDSAVLYTSWAVSAAWLA